MLRLRLSTAMSQSSAQRDRLSDNGKDIVNSLPLARRAFQRNLAAMRNHQFTRDRQPQSHALFDAPSSIAAIERLEDFFPFIRLARPRRYPLP